jgi:hypothetical protein
MKRREQALWEAQNRAREALAMKKKMESQRSNSFQEDSQDVFDSAEEKQARAIRRKQNEKFIQIAAQRARNIEVLNREGLTIRDVLGTPPSTAAPVLEGSSIDSSIDAEKQVNLMWEYALSKLNTEDNIYYDQEDVYGDFETSGQDYPEANEDTRRQTYIDPPVVSRGISLPRNAKNVRHRKTVSTTDFERVAMKFPLGRQKKVKDSKCRLM